MQFHNKMTKTITPILLAMLLAACHETPPPAAPPAPMFTRHGDTITVPAASPLRTRLTVAPADTAGGAAQLNLPAVVEADPARSVTIVPPLTGRLMRLPVHLGDSVRQGQLLAVISSPDLAQAFADADKAHDARMLAERALQRATGVNQAGANATKDVEQAQSGYTQALAEATRADARLAALNADRSGKSRLLNVTAPIAGTITAVNNGAGAYLNDPTATLMTISSLDHVWVTVNVPENLLAQVHAGQGADITLAAYPGQTWHGTVSTISPVLEADTRRDKARISFTNGDGKLKPNMFGSADLHLTPGAGAPSVPTSALLMDNDNVTVFVETAPWQFVRRSVVTGADEGTEEHPSVRILSGLRGGERVLVSGGVLLND